MPSRVVKVQKRSGYDKTYRNSLTANVGTLVPIFFDEVIPDTKVNLKINVAACLPPLVSDTYMNVKLRLEAFAVPHRLLMGNFEDFFADYPFDSVTMGVNVPSLYNKKNGCIPLIRLLGDETDLDGENIYDPNYQGSVAPAKYLLRGSLMDYLDYDISHVVEAGAFSDNLDVNVLPLVCYHLIWQEWYRQPRVQKPAFVRNVYDSVQQESVVSLFSGDSNPFASCLPYTNFAIDNSGQPTIAMVLDENDEYESANHYFLADGTHILDLRQRNFDLDYFTAAMVSPQQGDMAVVKFGQGDDPVDGFSIASLRAMNSIQQFRERNNLTSPRYQQQIFARYGTAPSNGVLQRPALIGVAQYDVYSHGVVQTSATESGDANNPFGGSLGARGGNGFAAGQDFIIRGFHAKEPMYIMVLASLVPEVTYSQGLSRIFERYIGKGSITDMANHILQNVGPQPIKQSEIYAANLASKDDVFAYADRYADWMIKKNMVHGEFRADGTLAHFVLQRNFTADPEYGSEFLEIPTDYLDSVLSVTAASMGFAYWLDSMLEYHVSMPLQQYCVPSLQDPAFEHGKSIKLRNNGQLL